MEMKNRRIIELENLVTELELDNSTKSRKLNELEQWIMCLTNSTLVAAGNENDSKTIQTQIQIVTIHFFILLTLHFSALTE